MPETPGQHWRWVGATAVAALLGMPAWGSAAGPCITPSSEGVGAKPAAVAPHPPDLAIDPPVLLMPVQGVALDAVPDTYTDQRGGGARVHEALDIMAPRGTPVLAVDSGRIAKLFLSKPGGITVYQFDPTGHFAYYYAHLDRYAEGLAEGQTVQRGQLLGYVGFTGNASPDAPHLHFGLFRLDAAQRWWTGVPMNPYPYLRGAEVETGKGAAAALPKP